MNMLISNEFGQYFARLPLKKSANIVHGDALEVNWQSLLNPVNTHTIYAEHTNIINIVSESQIPFGTVNVFTKTNATKTIEQIQKEQPNEIKFDYIIGNPPFIGSKIMTQLQRNQIVKEFDNIQGSGVLDYVTGWYIKAAKYIQNSKIKVAFVSTNSIVQGEQTSILWGQMLNKFSIKIHFAHRTFRWSNEAKGNAAVYCVIVGFANYDTNNKSIFEYENINGEAHEIKAKNINAYLVDAKDIFVEKRRKPICNIPEIKFGSMPNDGGYLILTDNEKIEFLKKEPNAEKYIKHLLSAKEFLNNENRWCFWLKDINPSDLKSLPETSKKVQSVKDYRNKSTREATRKLADFPTLFGENRQPNSDFILIPRHSSENRKFIPLGFFNSEYIPSDSCSFISNANLFHFGILMSTMHMAWVKTVCGRIKSDYRYSNELVYNNFPFPKNQTEKLVASIEEKAQNVLDVRSSFPNSSLADLYNPLTMPPTLIKAHNELDKAVDTAYRTAPFTSEANRMVYLFELYEKYTADLFTKEKPKKKK